MFDFIKRICAKISRKEYYLEKKYLIGYPTTYHIRRSYNGAEVLVLGPGNTKSPFVEEEALYVLDRLNLGIIDLSSEELNCYKPSSQVN